MGNLEILKRGEVQFTSAGSGVRHSEYNDHKKTEVHFLQIWYTPEERNLPPKYYTHPQMSDDEKRDKLVTMIRPHTTFTPEELKLTGLLPAGRAIPAHAQLVTRALLLSPGATVEHVVGNETGAKEGEERWLYVHLAMGSGWKDGDEFAAAQRRAASPDQPQANKLRHAAEFIASTYGERPSWTSSGSTPSAPLSKPNGRPLVTLTYAQSMDGFIAGPGKKQVALSSTESFVMTHALRTMHDGILVGVGTVLADNPQLNARLLNPLPDGKEVPVASLPRPIVLDASLRTPTDAKILANYAAKTGKQPIIVTSAGGVGASEGWAERHAALEAAGAQIVEVEGATSGSLPWPAVLSALDGAGITKLMVEGGASVIGSLLAAHSGQPLIDVLIATVARQVLEKGESYTAPKWLAKTLLPGSAASAPDAPAASKLASRTLTPEPFGKDFVFVWGGAERNAHQARIAVNDVELEEGDGVFVRGAIVGGKLTLNNVSGTDAEV